MNYRVENTFSGSFLYIDNGNILNDGNVNLEKYDITNMVSLAHEYNGKDASFEELYRIISALSQMGKRIEDNKFNINGLILNPEYIYLSFKVGEPLPKVVFIYYSSQTDLLLEEEIKSLAEYIIEHTDHDDKRAVQLAYGFYMQIHRGNYVFNKLLSGY